MSKNKDSSHKSRMRLLKQRGRYKGVPFSKDLAQWANDLSAKWQRDKKENKNA